MIAKQFVLSLYPNSRCIRLKEYPMNAKKYYISCAVATFWLTQGNTSKEAWTTTMNIIQKQFLDKPES